MIVTYNNYLISRVIYKLCEEIIILNTVSYGCISSVNFDQKNCFRLIFCNTQNMKPIEFSLYFVYCKRFTYFFILPDYIGIREYNFNGNVSCDETKIELENNEMYRIALKISNYIYYAYKI